jgi:hypothetical protein
MGMDLSGAGGYFGINCRAWGMVLELAQRFGGWVPLGTRAPSDWKEPDSAWDPMDYWSNSYQEVSDQDARNLADALERALLDVPRQRPAPGQTSGLNSDGATAELARPNCLEAWSGSDHRTSCSPSRASVELVVSESGDREVPAAPAAAVSPMKPGDGGGWTADYWRLQAVLVRKWNRAPTLRPSSQSQNPVVAVRTPGRAPPSALEGLPRPGLCHRQDQ